MPNPRHTQAVTWHVADLSPRHIGLRLVMDGWRRRRWPGFDVGSQSAEGDE
jgi:hypothetical protein